MSLSSGSAAKSSTQHPHRHSYTPQSIASQKKHEDLQRRTSFHAAQMMNAASMIIPQRDHNQFFMHPNSSLGQPDVLHGFVPWQSYNPQTNPSSMLADAYGATHGQPQPAAANLDWYNGLAASMLIDPRTHPAALPSALVQPQPSYMDMYHVSPPQLTQKMNQLHLQSQQQEQVAVQRRLLMSQFQQAQEQRLLADHQNTSMYLPHSGLMMNDAQSKQSIVDPNPDGFYLKSRVPVSNGKTAGPDETFISFMSTPEGKNQIYENNTSPNTSTLEKASNESSSPSESTNLRTGVRSRPVSFTSRDLRQESIGSPINHTSPQAELRLPSALRRGEDAHESSVERRRNLTPSIVIDEVNLEPSDDALTRKVNSVGMRMGPRTATVVHEIQVSPQESMYLGNNSEKISSVRGSDLSRPSSAQGVHPPPLIQPRRQPRGPPMDAFFANNFLARRSLRTRREAMSKLCASPRAPAFNMSRSSGVSTSSPLASKK
jgi:hypothetical protein